MTSKSDAELQSIIADTVNFVDDARLAVVWELEKRNQATDETELTKKAVLDKVATKQQQEQENKDNFKSPADLPTKIKSAAYLIYGSLAVGLIKSILIEQMTSVKILSDPKNLTIGLLTIGLIGFFAYMISVGKNWARITFLVLFIIGLLGLPFMISNDFKMSAIIGAISVVQALMQLFALIILFRGQANNWYKEQKIKTAPNKG